MAMKWDDLFSKGSVVDLSTSLWRARVQLKADDLGIEDSDEVRKALSLGCHRLAPAKAFEGLLAPARQAKKLIDYYSVNFGLIRGARFVPNKNVGALLKDLKEQRTLFRAAVDQFVQSYEATKDEMLPVIEKALRDAARTPEAAAKAFRRIRAEYPPASDIWGRFDLSWSIYTITAPSNKEAAEAMSDESGNVKGIVRSMVEQIRTEMSEKIGDLLSLAGKGGKLSERSIRSATELLDRLDNLNVFGDAALEMQIRTVRSWISGLEGGKATDGFITGITEVRKSLEEGLEDAVKSAEESLTGLGRRKLSNGSTKKPVEAAPLFPVEV